MRVISNRNPFAQVKIGRSQFITTSLRQPYGDLLEDKGKTWVIKLMTGEIVEDQSIFWRPMYE